MGIIGDGQADVNGFWMRDDQARSYEVMPVAFRAAEGPWVQGVVAHPSREVLPCSQAGWVVPGG